MSLFNLFTQSMILTIQRHCIHFYYYYNIIIPYTPYYSTLFSDTHSHTRFEYRLHIIYKILTLNSMTIINFITEHFHLIISFFEVTLIVY